MPSKTPKLPNEPIFSNPGGFDPGLIPEWDCFYRENIWEDLIPPAPLGVQSPDGIAFTGTTSNILIVPSFSRSCQLPLPQMNL